jgi:hypothetical protein
VKQRNGERVTGRKGEREEQRRDERGKGGNGERAKERRGTGERVRG